MRLSVGSTKSNSRNLPHQVAYSDWNNFFIDGRAETNWSGLHGSWPWKTEKAPSGL